MLVPEVHLTPRDRPVDRHRRAGRVSESGGVSRFAQAGTADPSAPGGRLMPGG